MDADFRRAYSRNGRPSVAPERLLKALLLQALYTIRSERELCRRLRTDLLFRWFLDMTPDEDVFVPTVFGWSKTVGGLRRSRHVCRWKIAQRVELTAAAYNLVRMRRLLAA
jgi:hypothetical protein